MTCFKGVYINLDRSPERRAAMETQLAKLGLAGRYNRLTATDGDLTTPTGAVTPSERACFRSHLNAIEAAGEFHCLAHIVEDDAVFATTFVKVVEALQGIGAFDPYDIVFTNTFVGANAAIVRVLKARFDEATEAEHPSFMVADFTDKFQCLATSYLIPANRIPIVRAVFQRELAAGPSAPIDMLIRREVSARKLKVGCIFPFVTTTFRPAGALPTTIADRDRDTAYSRSALSALGQSFFIDRDLDQLRAMLPPRREPQDKHAKLIDDVFNFVLSSPEFAMF